MPAHAYTLAELLIVAAAEAWRGNGEVLASGIGVVPRLAASLAKLTHSPELMMTDAEAYLVRSRYHSARAATTGRSTPATCPSRAFSTASGAANGT